VTANAGSFCYADIRYGTTDESNSLHIVQTSNKEQNLSWPDHFEKTVNSVKNVGVGGYFLVFDRLLMTN
jgi:hypothetical protein